MNTAPRHPAAHHENDHTSSHPQPTGHDVRRPAAGLSNTRAIGFVMGWEQDDPSAHEAEPVLQPVQS